MSQGVECYSCLPKTAWPPTSGLVHISEVSDTYVKNIRDHLKEKDKVRVKVISIDANGKISLSIKQAIPEKKSSVRPSEIDWSKEKAKPAQGNFEDRLSKFLKDSEERFQDIKKHKSDRSHVVL